MVDIGLIRARFSTEIGLKAFLLNKIEIGQFLYMKYKVRIREKIDTDKVIAADALRSWYGPLERPPIKIINPTVNVRTNTNPVGSESFKERPPEVKNPAFLSNFNPCFRFVVNATHNIVIQKAALDKFLSSIYSPSVTAKIVPAQKTKFQKLSLFIRSLTKFLILSIPIFKTVSSILAKFTGPGKKIKLYAFLNLTAALVSVDCAASPLTRLIDRIEREYSIPSGLLAAIASVESGGKPYALNISGRPFFAASKEEAKRILLSCFRRGLENVDVGVMQVNYRWHGENFGSISEMLEPEYNIEYAAKFLRRLYLDRGSWNEAVRSYHSSDRLRRAKYSKKILEAWLGS